MTVTGVITDIATGLGELVPAFSKALLDGFTSIFISTTEAGSVLSPVGQIAIVFICLGICYKILPTVIGWLRLYASKRKSRRKKSA